MSLSDALLLDPHREPREVWFVHARADRAIGSGKQSDPYNGSTVYSEPISITSLTTPDEVNNPLEAQAITDRPHGLEDNDVVIISGAGANGDWYDGWFLAKDTQIDGPNKFKYTMRFKPAATSATGRAMQKPLRYLFDERMAALEPNTSIHLSPGVFESRGQGQFVESNIGWKLKSGFRIKGAGMGLTTLKLVGGAVRERQSAAIYADTYLEGLEISDLTVDCNLEDQPNTDVLCAAVHVLGGGRHVRVRRVRAINWGSRFPDTYRENFVFFLAASPNAGDLVDSAFDECVAENPSPNNHWNSSIFLVGGNGEEGWRGKKAANYACAIRECYIDARNDYGPITQIQSITYAADDDPPESMDPAWIVTVTTKSAHGHTKPGNVIVSGVTVGAGGDYSPVYNGVFEIHAVDTQDGKVLQYRVPTNPGASGAGGAIGGRVSSNDVTVESVATTGTSMEYKLTTREPHGRTRNNTISVNYVRRTDNSQFSDELNGTFPIVKYDPAKPLELTYRTTLVANPAPGPSSSIGAFARTGHGAITVDNGVSEGNRVFHCGSGGPFHDTWSVRSIVARDNYYQDVLAGPAMGLSGFSVSTWPWGNGTFGRLELKSLEVQTDPPTNPPTYIAKTPLPSDPADDPNGTPSVRRHCLVPGDKVLVTWAGAVWTELPEFTVVSTPDAQTFKFVTTAILGIAPVFLPLVHNNTDAPDAFLGLRPLESIAVTPLANGKYKITATVRKLSYSETHELEKGELVKLGNVGDFQGGIPNRSTVLNGNFKITAVSMDGRAFDFEVDTNPGTITEPGYYGRIWRCDYWLFENNVVETSIRHLWYQAPTVRDAGLTINLGGHPPQYIASQVVIRDNLFRHVNNGSDPNKDEHSDYPLPRAMQFGSGLLSGGYAIEDALVQRNIIQLDSVSNVIAGEQVTPIEFQPNLDIQRGVQTFNNVSPEGVLIPAVNDPQIPTPEKRPELVLTIESGINDALCASFLF
jgi:hypothetical protein